jgi:hypothetical protein
MDATSKSWSLFACYSTYYRQLLYLSTHDMKFGYRHMSGCLDVQSVSGCPQLCNLNGTLSASWAAIFGEEPRPADFPVIYAAGS